MRSNNGEIMDDPFNAIDYTDDPEVRANILRIISELSMNQRMALLSYYYGGFTIQEVAIAMKVSSSMATDCLEHARANVLKEFGTMSTQTHLVPDIPQRSQVLVDILNELSVEKATDEQVQRVLEPVLTMIREGKFDKPKRSRFRWWVKPMLSVVAVAVIALATVFGQTATVPNSSEVSRGYIAVSDADIPLAAKPGLNTLSGQVSMEDKGVGGIEVLLIDAVSMKTIETATTNIDGSYQFNKVPDGTYRIEAVLPDGMTLVGENMHETIYELGKDTDKTLEGVNIQVWKTK